MDNILKILNDKHGYDKDFSKYVKFCIENLYEGDEYSERHHILTRAQFPEYINSDWNIIRLKYEDHIRAHLLLADICPIGSYLRPLHYMLPRDEGYRDRLSAIRKEEWVYFKTTKKYAEWQTKHKTFCKEAYSEGGIYRDHILKMSQLGNTPEAIAKKKETVKEYWTAEKRAEHGKNVSDRYKNDPTIREKISKTVKSMWSDPKMDEVKAKMAEQSRSKERIEKVSAGVKLALSKPHTREKMSASAIGKVWWNNGILETKSKDSPGESWVRGRVFKYTKDMVEKRNMTNRKKHEN